MPNAIDPQSIIDQVNALNADGSFSADDVQFLINYLISNGDMTGTPRDLIQIRRGNKADLPTLAQGEMAFVLDTEEFFIGGTSGNVPLVGGVQADILQRGVNIKSIPYSAKGDGITDDTAAIQSAITSLGATGGTIIIPVGTFLFSSPITIPSNVCMLGVNRNLSVLKATANGSFISGDNSSNVTLRNFTLDGNGKNSSISFQAHTTDMSQIFIQSVTVKNSGTITDLASWSPNIIIKRWLTHSIHDVILSDLYCEGAASDGQDAGDNIYIASYGSDGTGTLTNVVIDNCILKKAGRQNISLSGDNTDSRPNYISITNVIMEDSCLAGIDFEEANKVTISNCHFINNGNYTAYYNGTHVAETTPTTVMRSAIALHGLNNAMISNCVFDSCYYGLGGNGFQIFVDNCKFIDSKISNADQAASPQLIISNCDIQASGAIDYLVSRYNGPLSMVNCRFSGTTSSGYMVFLQSGATNESYYHEIDFIGCVFQGQVDRSMNAVKIQYAWYRFENCIFNNFDMVFNLYQANSASNLEVVGNQIRNVNKVVETATIAVNNLVFKNNYCEGIKIIAEFTTHAFNLLFSDNLFYLQFDDADGFTHNAINVPNGCGVKNFVYRNNLMVNSGTATDVTGVAANVRSQEMPTDSLDISHNSFTNMLNAISITLYAGSTQARNAVVVGNMGKTVTTLISSFAGLNENSAVVRDNLNEGVMDITQYPRISGTTAQRPTSPLTGQRYYDTTTSASIVWNGSAWV